MGWDLVRFGGKVGGAILADRCTAEAGSPIWQAPHLYPTSCSEISGTTISFCSKVSEARSETRQSKFCGSSCSTGTAGPVQTEWGYDRCWNQTTAQVSSLHLFCNALEASELKFEPLPPSSNSVPPSSCLIGYNLPLLQNRGVLSDLSSWIWIPHATSGPELFVDVCSSRHLAPKELAELFYPLLVKSFTTLQEPIQAKGGGGSLEQSGGPSQPTFELTRGQGHETNSEAEAPSILCLNSTGYALQCACWWLRGTRFAWTATTSLIRYSVPWHSGGLLPRHPSICSSWITWMDRRETCKAIQFLQPWCGWLSSSSRWFGWRQWIFAEWCTPTAWTSSIRDAQLNVVCHTGKSFVAWESCRFKTWWRSCWPDIWLCLQAYYEEGHGKAGRTTWQPARAFFSSYGPHTAKSSGSGLTQGRRGGVGRWLGHRSPKRWWGEARWWGQAHGQDGDWRVFTPCNDPKHEEGENWIVADLQREGEQATKIWLL